MPTLTVRNVPAAVIRALKEMARENGRSMEQEVRQLLSSLALDRVSACRQIEDSWKRQSRPTSREEVDAWIRESRR